MTTDDGFVVESCETRSSSEPPKVFRWIVLALDEIEALDLLRSEMPNLQYKIIESGSDIRAQAARLGVEPGTYRQV